MHISGRLSLQQRPGYAANFAAGRRAVPRPGSSQGPAGRLGARTPAAKWRVQVAEIQSAVDEAAQLAEEVSDVIDETLSGGAPSSSTREEDVVLLQGVRMALRGMLVTLSVNMLVDCKGRVSCLYGRRQTWSAQHATSSGNHSLGCESARTYGPVCVS